MRASFMAIFMRKALFAVRLIGRDDSVISGTKGIGLIDLTEKQRSYSDGLIRKLDALDQTHSEKPSEPKP